jgi:hypothetical protein
MLDSFSELMQLLAQELFITFSHHKSFKPCLILCIIGYYCMVQLQVADGEDSLQIPEVVDKIVR